MTNHESRLQSDCLARLQAKADELNELLKEAAKLGIEREVIVVPRDESSSTMDLRPNRDWNAWLPVSTRGEKYPEVLILKPGQFKESQ